MSVLAAKSNSNKKTHTLDFLNERRQKSEQQSNVHERILEMPQSTFKQVASFSIGILMAHGKKNTTIKYAIYVADAISEKKKKHTYKKRTYIGKWKIHPNLIKE